MPDAPFGDLVPGSLPWSLAGAAWTWLLALFLGAAALRLVRQLQLRPSATTLPAAPADAGELVAWAVLGIPLQALAWLALSACGALRPLPVVAVAAVLSAVAGLLGGRDALRALRSAAQRAREALARSPALEAADAATDRPTAAPWLRVVALRGVLVVSLLAGLLALTPTVHYDDLVYHLGLPRQALLLGSWPALPHFHHAFMPAGWEVNSVLSLSLGGGSGPQFANVIALALLAVVTLRIARSLGASLPAAGGASLLLLSSPVFLGSGALAGNDLFVALGLCSALERLLASRGGRVLLAGLLAGAAWSAKFVALPGIAGLALATLTLRSGSRGARARAAVLLVAAALCVGLPWTLRAAVQTGNPTYPAFHSLLGGQSWDADAARLLTRDSAMGALPLRGVAAFPLSVRDLLLRSETLGTPSGLDALVLLLALVGAVIVKRDRRCWALVFFVVLGWAGWCATSLMLRFALAWLVALVPFGALAIDAALRRVRSRIGARGADAVLATLLAVFAFVFLLSGSAAHLRQYGVPPPPLVPRERQDTLVSRIHLAAAGRDMARGLPRDAALLVVGEARLGLLPRRAVISSALDAPAVAAYLDGASSPGDVTRRARSAGLTHVLVNDRELERFSEKYGFRSRLGARESALLVEWLRGLEPAGQWGPVTLFRLP